MSTTPAKPLTPRDVWGDLWGFNRTVEDWEQDPDYEAAMHQALTDDPGRAADRILTKMQAGWY